MATVTEIQEQLAALAVNQSEAATEVGRIRGVLEQIREQLSQGASPEELNDIMQQVTSLVSESQAVEDSLRVTE